MPAVTASNGEDAQLRECIDALARALRAKDISALMTHYAADIVTFDIKPPLQVRGIDAYRKNFEAWFASMQGPIDYEMHDVRITMRDDIAFCHGLSRITGTRTTGKKIEYWVRVTTAFRKTSSKWKVIHEHVSLPSSM